MENHELIKRYIYAVVKTLPHRMREDVEKELHGLIADMLEERCGDVPPTDHDVRVVLTELGLPGELAAQYRPEHDRYLIGPRYYGKYKQIITLVLMAVAIGLSVAGTVMMIVSTAPWYQVLGEWIGTLFSSLFAVFAAITLVFAALERKGVKVDVGAEDLSHLPPVPKKQARISRWESGFGLVVGVLFLLFFLVAPELICVITPEQTVPVFDVPRLRALWAVILGSVALGMGKDLFKFVEGRYTKRLAIVNGVANAGSAVLAVVLFSGASLLNPALGPLLTTWIGAEIEPLTWILAHVNQMLLGIVLFALILDTAITAYRGYKYDR